VTLLLLLFAISVLWKPKNVNRLHIYPHMVEANMITFVFVVSGIMGAPRLH